MSGQGQMTDKFSMLSGLGIRPDWVKEHPQEAAAAGLVAAAPFTGGASLAALGPGAAAGGAAAGTAAVGSAAAEAAAGGAAGMAGAGEAGLLGAGGLAAGDSAAGAAGLEGASMGAASQAPQFSAQMAAASSDVPSLGTGAMDMGGMSGTNIPGSNPSMFGQAKPYMDKASDAFSAYNKGQQLNNMMNPQPQHMQVQRPMSMGDKSNFNQAPMSTTTFGGGVQGPFSSQGGFGVQAVAPKMTPTQMMMMKRMGLLGGMQ